MMDARTSYRWRVEFGHAWGCYVVSDGDTADVIALARAHLLAVAPYQQGMIDRVRRPYPRAECVDTVVVDARAILH